jgi:histidinol-phosphate aminotransferase
MITSGLTRPCVGTLTPYVPGKPIEEVRREFGLTDIIKLASNENPALPRR